MSELTGRKDGISKGKGGSMHIGIPWALGGGAQVFRQVPNHPISDYSNALIYSRKAIDSNGDNPLFYFKAGQLLMKNGDFSDAIFYFENSINLGYVEIDVWNDLLDCLIKLYRFNHAKNIISKALDLFKNSPSLIFRLGVIQIKQGNSKKALKYLKSIDQKVLSKLLRNVLYSDLSSII